MDNSTFIKKNSIQVFMILKELEELKNIISDNNITSKINSIAKSIEQNNEDRMEHFGIKISRYERKKIISIMELMK